MKTKIILLLTVVSTLSLSAQDNNRMDEIGKQYLPSIALIKADVENGKVTEINQETIDNYAKLIPLKTEMNLTLANGIFEIKKEGTVQFEKYIANTKNISIETKAFITKICTPESAVNETNYQKYYTGLVKEIEKTNISPQEKDMLLALNSIAFNVSKDGGDIEKDGRPGINNIRNNGEDCIVQSEQGSGYISSTACVILVAGIGFIAGFEWCGFWCGVGGAVIFGVLAAITIC